MNPFMERLFPANDLVKRRQVRGLPQLVPCTEMFTGYLHEEMRQTYLNGHDHAAIVSGCALIDFCVKDTIHFELFVRADCVLNPEEWDEIDRLNFGRAINLAKSRRIVTKDEHKELEWIRKHIRNVYMHGKTPPSLKEEEFDGLVEGNLKTGEVKKRKVSLRDNLTIQRMMRLVKDRDNCERVIPLVDRLVRTLSVRSVAMLEKWKKDNASKPTSRQVEKVLESMQKAGYQADMIITREFPDDVKNDGTGEEILSGGPGSDESQK